MLEIVGVGYGRTGTLSLKTALERLGFGPCYHAVEFLRHPEHQTDGRRLSTATLTGRRCSLDIAPPLIFQAQPSGGS